MIRAFRFTPCDYFYLRCKPSGFPLVAFCRGCSRSRSVSPHVENCTCCISTAKRLPLQSLTLSRGCVVPPRMAGVLVSNDVSQKFYFCETRKAIYNMDVVNWRNSLLRGTTDIHVRSYTQIHHKTTMASPSFKRPKQTKIERVDTSSIHRHPCLWIDGEFFCLAKKHRCCLESRTSLSVLRGLLSWKP